MKALQVEEQVTSNRDNAIDNDDDVVQDNSALVEVDLLTVIPENFNEIPYITQINAKKKVMESFNNELERLVTKKNPIVPNKDYSLIFNVVTHVRPIQV